MKVKREGREFYINFIPIQHLNIAAEWPPSAIPHIIR